MMGLDFSSSSWSRRTMPRGWRLLLLTVTALTVLLIVPLYQLSSHDAKDYYKHYIYDHLSKYLGQDGVYNNTLYQNSSNNAVHAQFNFSHPCQGFPDLDGIMLVMKTGATEAYDKMPTQLLTNLQCVPDFLLFSDLEQQIGKYHVYNVLENVAPAVLEENLSEFKLYDVQRTCPVSQKDCTKDMKGGWELDKYKFLHMIEKAWELRPGMEWYVFAEADTYVFWDNIVYWLRHKADATKFPYVGSVAFLGNKPFAHGGSGYVISGKTVEKMVEIPNLATKYDMMAPNECCGDLLMALAVEESGGHVKTAHPMFNGEKPNTLPYGHGHWCEPLLTMHHMNSEEVSSVWQYEQTRTTRKLIQIRDMYHAFFAPNLQPLRMDWDNLSDDVCYIGIEPSDQDKAQGHEKSRQMAQKDKNVIERRAHMSPSACSKVCEAAGLDIDEEEYQKLHTEAERDDYIRRMYEEKGDDEDWQKERECFQWRYRNGACCIAKSFKLGTPKQEASLEKRSYSGWFVDGINDWIDAMGDCEPEWKEPH